MSESLKRAEACGDTAYIDLWYPRVDDIKYIEVGLMDVRAADSIRISYDYDRDGYSIEQASRFEWGVDDKDMNPDWQEVAFVESWGREKKSQVDSRKPHQSGTKPA